MGATRRSRAGGVAPATASPTAPGATARAGRREQPGLGIPWLVAAALTFWSFGFTPMRSSDLWWHLASGRWIWTHAALPVHDPFGYTAPDRVWLNDAWLSDVLLWSWVRAFGLASLAYWKWGLIVLAWLVLLRLLARLGSDRTIAYATATFGLALAAPFLDLRPQLYGFLGLALVLDGTLGRSRPGAWLPLVFLMWANLHASFALGLLTLPLVLAPALSDRRERRRALTLGALCVGATLCTPNGVRAISRPLLHALDPGFRDIAEWVPPFEAGGIHSWLYPYGLAAFPVAVLALVLDPRRRRAVEPWVAVTIGVGVLGMSLRSRRFVPFFGMAETLVLAAALAPLGAWLRTRAVALLAPLAALGLAAYWLAPYPKSAVAFHYLTNDFELPVETLDFAEANRLSGTVLPYYGWGSYVDWRTDGRLQVFVDGRGETVFADETLERYLAVSGRRPGWIDVVERSGADFVLWPRWEQADVVDALVATGRWKSVYEDYASHLLARATVRLPEPLVATSDSAFRFLALGMTALLEERFAEARRLLARALALEPDLQPACVTLAQAQLLGGDPTGADATAARCAAAFPDAKRDQQLAAALRSMRSEGPGGARR